MMREELRRRQALLHAMGITTWYPRVLLPGAPPPLDWSEDEEPAAGQGAAAPEALPEGGMTAADVPPAALHSADVAAGAGFGPAPARVAPRPLPTFDDRPPASPAASSAAPHRPTTGLAPDAEAAPRFTLVFLAASPGLGLVVLLPQTAEPWLGPVRRALLSELLLARVGQGLSPELDERPFRWPLGPGLDASASAARAALGGFLESQAEEAGCRLLLVLGEQLKSLLPLSPEAQRGIPYPLPEQPWRLLLTRSLDEVLTVPGLKRELWQDLAPLAGALR